MIKFLRHKKAFTPLESSATCSGVKTRPFLTGFTLIEVVLTIVLIGIIFGVTAKILLSGLDVYSLVTSRRDAFEQARMAMERMRGEIATIDVLTSGDLNLYSMTEDNMCFVNPDGTRRLRKRIVNNIPILYLGEGCGIATYHELALNTPVVVFTYHEIGGHVRGIGIELATQGTGEAGTVWLRSAVFPRSQMYGDFE